MEPCSTHFRQYRIKTPVIQPQSQGSYIIPIHLLDWKPTNLRFNPIPQKLHSSLTLHFPPRLDVDTLGHFSSPHGRQLAAEQIWDLFNELFKRAGSGWSPCCNAEELWDYMGLARPPAQPVWAPPLGLWMFRWMVEWIDHDTVPVCGRVVRYCMLFIVCWARWLGLSNMHWTFTSLCLSSVCPAVCPHLSYLLPLFPSLSTCLFPNVSLLLSQPGGGVSSRQANDWPQLQSLGWAVFPAASQPSPGGKEGR